MSDKTKIAWTEATWNPVTGCSKVSEGCRNCYAERVWPRLSASPGRYFGREFGDVRIHPETLDIPLRWTRPRQIFVASMADLFHQSVPDAFIDHVFSVMAQASRHTFQILTKRPERAKAFLSGREILPNVWLGVSAEDQKTLNERIPVLLSTPAALRWVSIEPMIGPVTFRWAKWQDEFKVDPKTGQESMNHLDGLRRLDWLVVGGETGPKARSMNGGWVRILVGECREAGVPLFVKQLGTAYSDPLNGVAGAGLKISPDAINLLSNRLSDRSGADSGEWPEDLRVREYPKKASKQGEPRENDGGGRRKASGEELRTVRKQKVRI